MKTITFYMPCNGQIHRVEIDEQLRLRLLDHDAEADLIAEQLGSETGECIWLHKEWKPRSYERALSYEQALENLMAFLPDTVSKNAAVGWATHVIWVIDDEDGRNIAHQILQCFEDIECSDLKVDQLVASFMEMDAVFGWGAGASGSRRAGWAVADVTTQYITPPILRQISRNAIKAAEFARGGRGKDGEAWWQLEHLAATTKEFYGLKP